MSASGSKKDARFKRKKRIRKKISGTAERPRLSVFRSARHIYAQMVDDVSGHTLTAASSLEDAVRARVVEASQASEQADAEAPKKGKSKKNKKAPAKKSGKIAVADAVGKLVGERALEKGIRSIVFDRNGFLYHGRVKALSDGVREAGLSF